MFTLKHLIGGSLFVFVLAGTAIAQENRAPIETPREPVASGPLVTAAATAKRVRFVSPGTVVQLRLEIYNEAGQKLFDTELHGGNVLDWQLQDGAGERLAAGSYACVLTIKSLSGRLSQRVGVVRVNEKRAAMETEGAAQLSTAQQQTIGPVEGNTAFTVLQESEAEAITAVTHDGDNGQLTRTRGALSFRLGDFFSGKDKEQMLLTEEGNLGIGTDSPQAKLDVAGVIRTSKGIEFDNGTNVTRLTTTAAGNLQQTLADGTVVANVSGTGTQNQVAKWTDSAGTLGDSTITEVGGKVGIGVTNPSYRLVVGPDIGPGLTTSDLTISRGPGQSISIFAGATGAHGMNFGWDEANLRAFVNAPVESPITFTHGGVSERMRIETTGNVGIGTNNPSSLLDVAGNINTSTQFNIGGSRVLSVPAGGNLFAGVGAGQLNSTGSNNSFFGQQAGQLNTMGVKNSFFGGGAGKNTTGGSNSFFGERAGFGNQAGTFNSFFGIEAGFNNTTGNSNLFIGAFSGFSNSRENNNTFIGYQANGAGGITNATAIGANAVVSQSNSLVLGSISGIGGTDTNVGIGTSNPARRLHITGTGSDGAGQTDVRITGTGPIASGITLESTGTGGRIYSWLSTADNTGGGGSGPGRLAVFDVTAGLYRMVIDGSGNVGIGTFTPGYKLEVNGSVAGLGPYQDISDVRFKKNISPVTGALNKVLHLRGVTFDWRSDEFPALNFGQGRQVGFIAQEMAGVLPEAVTKDPKGYYRMAYAEVTPVLVEAIKEQQQTIEKLQQENNKLKGRNADTETRLANVETTVKRMAQTKRRHRRLR